MSDKPLWTPSAERIAQAHLTAFHRRLVEDFPQLAEADYAALHDWSLRERDAFWSAVWDYAGIIGDKGETISAGDGMPGTRFFPEARLNFAENLIERGDPDALALRYRGEDGVKRKLTRAELRDRVHRMARYLRAAGVEPGDRVAAMLPNRPETVIAMLATATIGGIFSSCSPDFGPAGVLDRFGQIRPKVFIACADYRYGGRHFDTRDKAEEVRRQLDTVTLAVMLDDEEPVLPEKSPFRGWDEMLQGDAPPPNYRQLPFNHPLYILFSSGTTGAPKCIVHGAGGTLLQHVKEHRLHADMQPGDPVFYFTTCGWMMWNWLVSALASDATLMLYDGSPFHPDGNVLFDYADQARCAFFGVSAKYIDALKSNGYVPRETHALTGLRSLASTGSPLMPEAFDYIYASIKGDLAVQSISGGTDIVSCFVLGNPWRPVHRGEIQCAGLGMATDVWTSDGKPAPLGEKGDLVCTAPFPSMPLGFWDDPDDARYKKAYFSEFPGVWHHGDYAEKTPHGGFIIHGRSDATLNPGGVRIGTAEIYRQVEQLEAVEESLAVGQPWEDDVRIVLFVVLTAGSVLDQDLEQKIRQRIRDGASPRHVPAKIIQVRDLPRTLSGKLAELAVRSVILGEPVKNAHALANPESLDQFKHLHELQCA